MTKKKNTNIPDYMPVSDYSEENNTDTKIETDNITEKKGVKINIDEDSTLINNIEISDDEEENNEEDIDDVIESINKTMEKNASNYTDEEENNEEDIDDVEEENNEKKCDNKEENKNIDLLYRISYIIDELDTNGDMNDKLDNALLEVLKILKMDIVKNNNISQYSLLIKKINSIKLKLFKKKELSAIKIRDIIFYTDNSENIGYEIKRILDKNKREKLEVYKQRAKEIKQAHKNIIWQNIKDSIELRFRHV